VVSLGNGVLESACGIARRLVMMVLVCTCTLLFTLTLGAGASLAAGSFLFGPPGEEAGEISDTAGMAIDQEQGSVYVGDYNNNRVEKFNQAGEFVTAWGRAGQSGEELGGEFSDFAGPMGLAVDNDPLSLSDHDVYVVDFGNERVQKFDPSGKFLLAFGGHVNVKTDGDVCVAGEECARGSIGAGDGEFDWVYDNAYIAVGPGGAVYVGDKARVEVFEPSGAWKENISLSGLSSEGKVTALAVNEAGDVFVKDEGVPGVREFAPNGTEMPAKFDEGSESVQAIALDAAGDLLVSDTAGGIHFLKFSPSGKELASFGMGTFVYSTSGMAYDDALEELYVFGDDQFVGSGGASTQEYGNQGVWTFPVPSLGPLVESGSEKSTAELRGNATLEATIDPEGNETSYRFEYVDEADFKANGYANAVATAAVSIGSSFEDQLASVHLTGLAPGGTYHWRVVATDAQSRTATGSDETVQPIAPALIEGPSASKLTSSSVTLSAGIDPLGANTTYRLEYGTSTSYGHVFSGDAGEAMGYVTVNYPLQGLESGTTYHYRLVTSSEVGVVEGADHTVTTQLAGGALTLPDGRAWELVSPPDKGGALIEDIETAQAASDGSGIAYGATEPIGENVVGHLANPGEPGQSVTLVSERGATGWSTRDVSQTQTLPPEGETATELFEAKGQFELFSPDLSLAAFQPQGDLAPLSTEATEKTLYLRDNASEKFLPIVSAADVPPGTKYGAPPGGKELDAEMEFMGATPDLGHIVFATSLALTPEAVVGKSRNLYEWGAGHLQLVNSMPGGPAEPPPALTLGSASSTFTVGLSGHAISSDGRWVVFRYEHGSNKNGVTYDVRDMVEGKTVEFGGHHASWQTMNSDGSKVFYIESPGGGRQEFGGESKEGDLYVFDPASGVTTDLTADHLDDEHSAQVQNTLLGSSEDGSYVYFVAKGVLADGATSGEDNLYVAHENNGRWTTTFITTLGSEDEHSWFYNAEASNAPALKPAYVSSRVSPNGRFVTFMSNRSLTGYDNRDAVSGQPDEEVYLYDAATSHLACVSCNPSGARPVGVYQNEDKGEESSPLLLDGHGGGPPTWAAHWLAGVISPAWHGVGNGAEGYATYQPRYLSDSGRLFFDSAEALVPQDTNGLADVYEYEPSGVGSCTETDATFSERSDGCVDLISSGQSASESTFFDASESGDDVFFITTSKLVSEDYDTAYDVYDAHVCTTAEPCRTEPVSPPPCTSGDSCKAAPSPQPAIFGAAPSATFSGVGNVLPTAAVGKQKTLTRAQKLALALKTCHRKAKRKRAACERQARKRYGATQSRNSKATRKGDR
jgi:hypothetical protein